MNKNNFSASLFGVAFMAALLLCAPSVHATKQTIQRIISKDWFNKGYGFQMAEKHQEAIEAYSKAIEVNPKFAAAYCGRGLSYDGTGDHLRAIEDYNKALKLNPKFAAAYYYRGKSYATLDDNTRAIKDFKTAARLGEQNARKFLKSENIPW